MNDIWKKIKLGLCMLALPLIATAVASAHSWGGGETVNSPAISNTSSTNLFAERNHVVNLDENGFVNGRVVAINAENQAQGLSGLKVKFLKNGQIAKVVFTENDGSFRVQGLSEGTYSFVADSKSAFVAHGVKIVKSNGSPSLVTAAISPGFARIYDIISDSVNNPVHSHLIKASNKKQLNVPAVSGNQIQIIGNTISGKIYAANSQGLENTKVYLFQQRTQVAQVSASRTGEFIFDNIQPGVYDFVAAGPNGYSAASFEAVQMSSVAMRQVSFASKANIAAEMAIVLNSPEPVGFEPQESVVEEIEVTQNLGDQTALGPVFGEEYFIVDAGPGGFGGSVPVMNGDWVSKAALTTAIIALATDGDPADATPSK